MTDTRDLEKLMRLGASSPTPEAVAELYRQAFHDFGALALWSSKPVADPTTADALAITRSLRVERNRAARRLAEQIEKAFRATL